MNLSLTSRAAALAFVTAFVTLFMQILVHRMVSAKLLNNYAFLVISLTMLGFAFSGVLLSRWLPRFLGSLREAVNLCAACFAITVISASIIFYRAEAGVQLVGTRPDFVLALASWIPLALLYAVPFVFCGLILGALLSSPHLPTRRIYCVDLVGSALGAVAAIPAITYLGVERSMLAACAGLLIGGVALLCPQWRVSRGLTVVAGLVVLYCMIFADRVFVIHYPSGSMLANVQQNVGAGAVEHIAWDPLARIEVSRIPPPNPSVMLYPALIGENQTFLRRFKRMLSQNNYAFTYAVDYDGTRQSLLGIEETIYSAAYQVESVPRPKVLVVGVGGGFDILNALAFNASQVTGVEINSAIVDILTRTYRDYFREWVDDPRVRIVRGDGRHFLETTDSRFDIIQLSGVDSYSGTPGAAHVFSESFLYTAEAFDLYLSRLTDSGILNMMRLEFYPPREMLRALATAVESLRRRSIKEPADHIMTVTQNNGGFTALLVKKTPFTSAERKRLQAWTGDRTHFYLSAGPQLNEERANTYQTFLSLGDPIRESIFLARYPFNIWPIDDDQPFFFRYSYWWHLFPADPMIWGYSIPVMEYSVVLLVIIVGMVAMLFIYLPLRFFAKQGLRTPQAARYALYFAGTGLGYMAIEIALLQKFGLVLGHPNYALSVVLAALLLTTGLGSLFSAQIVKTLGNPRFVSYALAGLILAEYALVSAWVPNLIGLPFWLKVTLVFVFVLPLGACLGTFVPYALDQMKVGAAPFVPWAWGINGIFSVLAPVLSVAFSISWGINALLLAAIPIYLAVGNSLPAQVESVPVCSEGLAPSPIR